MWTVVIIAESNGEVSSKAFEDQPAMSEFTSSLNWDDISMVSIMKEDRD
jgi:hypothetical protein